MRQLEVEEIVLCVRHVQLRLAIVLCWVEVVRNDAEGRISPETVEACARARAAVGQ